MAAALCDDVLRHAFSYLDPVEAFNLSVAVKTTTTAETTTMDRFFDILRDSCEIREKLELKYYEGYYRWNYMHFIAFRTNDIFRIHNGVAGNIDEDYSIWRCNSLIIDNYVTYECTEPIKEYQTFESIAEMPRDFPIYNTNKVYISNKMTFNLSQPMYDVFRKIKKILSNKYILARVSL